MPRNARKQPHGALFGHQIWAPKALNENLVLTCLILSATMRTVKATAARRGQQEIETMSNATTEISGHNEIITMTMAGTGIETRDRDRSGYLVTSGSDREIGIAISTRDEVIIYCITNADEMALPEYHEGGSEWLYDLGDKRPDLDETEDQEHSRRILEGAKRVEDVLDVIRERYDASQEAVEESIEFYAAIVSDARADVSEMAN